MKLLLPYLAIVAVMIALDVLWIGVVARPLYARGIGHLDRKSTRLNSSHVD